MRIPSLPVALAAALAAMPAGAATLRSYVALHAGVVRLSDLFDDAGKQADRVLGPGPAPGARIVVEALQLAAIARQFGVDWRPVSGMEREVLERPGEPLARDAVLKALHGALAEAGAGDDFDVEAPTLALPLVPSGVTPVVTVAQMALDSASGRFSAQVLVAGGDMAPARLAVQGQAVRMRDVVVAARRLRAGETIDAGDVRLERVRDNAPDAPVIDPAQAVGMALRQGIAPGQVLHPAALEAPSLVRRGALVLVALDAPGLSLTARAEALQSGAMGQRVRLRNPASRAVLEGEVTGPGQVRVLPGSLPVLGPARDVREVAAQ